MPAAPNLPRSGLVWLKAATLRLLWRRAFREINGTEGQIIVSEDDDSLTFSLDPRAGLPDPRTVVVFCNGGLATLDIYASGDPTPLP